MYEKHLESMVEKLQSELRSANAELSVLREQAKQKAAVSEVHRDVRSSSKK